MAGCPIAGACAAIPRCDLRCGFVIIFTCHARVCTPSFVAASGNLFSRTRKRMPRIRFPCHPRVFILTFVVSCGDLRYPSLYKAYTAISRCEYGHKHGLGLCRAFAAWISALSRAGLCRKEEGLKCRPSSFLHYPSPGLWLHVEILAEWKYFQNIFIFL
jgi:hypothetical protein